MEEGGTVTPSDKFEMYAKLKIRELEKDLAELKEVKLDRLEFAPWKKAIWLIATGVLGAAGQAIFSLLNHSH